MIIHQKDNVTMGEESQEKVKKVFLLRNRMEMEECQTKWKCCELSRDARIYDQIKYA